MQKMQKIKTIKNLDMFRGIAAILVLLFHFYTFYSLDLLNISHYFKILSIGHIGVDLFFVLSGFLITLSLWNSKSFSHFFIKRIKRIAPLAILTTFVFWWIKTDFLEITLFNITDLFSHIFFVNGFFPQFYSTINPVTWSISIEMAFYILLPVIWIIFAKKNMKKFFSIFSVLVFLSFLYRAFLFYYFQENPEINSHVKIIYSEQLWGRLDQFFIGIILAYFYNNINNINYIKNTKIIIFSISSVLLIIAGYLFFEYQSNFRDILLLQVFLHTVTALGFAGFLYLFVQSKDESFIKNNVVTHIFSWLGKISYGMYIFHFPVISIIHNNFSLIYPIFTEFLIIACITIILSYISYNYFEKRF